MKWKVKKDPQNKDVRWRLRFAWRPIDACTYHDSHDRYWVWLEYYKQKQQYLPRYDVIVGVDVMRWTTIENYIK